jgi:8-oxo-dGTP pyrophosphatase MutT (NUDIX family)
MSDKPNPDYVLGYVFDEKNERFIGVEKAHPKWQAGKINGVGGKIEWEWTDTPWKSTFRIVDGNWIQEDPNEAMSREFLEETGFLIPPAEWTCGIHVYFGSNDPAGKSGLMYVFFTQSQAAHEFIDKPDYVWPTDERIFSVKAGVQETVIPRMNNVGWHTCFFKYLLDHQNDVPMLPITLHY